MFLYIHVNLVIYSLELESIHILVLACYTQIFACLLHMEFGIKEKKEHEQVDLWQEWIQKYVSPYLPPQFSSEELSVDKDTVKRE